MNNSHVCLGSLYSSELLKELNARGIRWKRIGDISGHRESYLKGVAYDSSKKLTLHCFITLLQQFRCSDTLKSIGREMNCIVYKMPDTCLSKGVVLKKAVSVMKEAVKTLEVVEDSIADNEYSDEEKEETYLKIEKTMEALLELKQCLREFY